MCSILLIHDTDLGGAIMSMETMIFVQYLSNQRQRLALGGRLGRNKKIVNIPENSSTLRETDGVTAVLDTVPL